MSAIVSKKPVASCRFKVKHIDNGFNLVELVITVALGGLLIGVLSDTLLRQLIDSRKVKESLAVREISSRLAYLLQVEASEARGVEYSGLSLPSDCGLASKIYFKLNIPMPTGDILTSTSEVYYYQDYTSIKRCGPGFNQNGTLVHPAEGNEVEYVDSVVASKASINLVRQGGEVPSSCGGAVSTEREISYVMTFLESGSSFQPLCNVIKARTFYVEDPPSVP